MTDKPHILMGMYMIHKGAYKGCIWDLCMLWVRFFFFHCSEHHTEVWSAEKSFSQHWSVLKSVWSVQRDWVEPSLYDQYLAYRNRHYTFLPGFGWSVTACLNSAEKVLCIFIYFTLFFLFFFFLNVALYYTSPFHSIPVFSRDFYILPLRQWRALLWSLTL